MHKDIKILIKTLSPQTSLYSFMIQYILDLAFCSRISAFFDRPAIQAKCKGVNFLFVTSLGEAPLTKTEKRTRMSISEDNSIHNQG